MLLTSDKNMLLVSTLLFSGICVSLGAHQETVTFLDWARKSAEYDEVPPLELHSTGNKKYYFENIVKGNYFQAMQFCIYHGMRLLTIASNQESDYLEKKIHELGLSRYYFWSSGTTLPSEHWVWMSTGRPIVYSKWNKGEPNGKGTKEECLQIIMNDGKLVWNDAGCSTSNHFICEITPKTYQHSLPEKYEGKVTTPDLAG